VYDLFVEEHSRRRGYGRAILAAVERDLMENACRQVWLNVFGYNTSALEFYRAVGYQIGTIHMTRLLAE
jgi:ribosomal protein S18 acetylase RimI-like enzyme